MERKHSQLYGEPINQDCISIVVSKQPQHTPKEFTFIPDGQEQYWQEYFGKFFDNKELPPALLKVNHGDLGKRRTTSWCDGHDGTYTFPCDSDF